MFYNYILIHSYNLYFYIHIQSITPLGHPLNVYPTRIKFTGRKHKYLPLLAKNSSVIIIFGFNEDIEKKHWKKMVEEVKKEEDLFEDATNYELYLWS